MSYEYGSEELHREDDRGGTKGVSCPGPGRERVQNWVPITLYVLRGGVLSDDFVPGPAKASAW